MESFLRTGLPSFWSLPLPSRLFHCFQVTRSERGCAPEKDSCELIHCVSIEIVIQREPNEITGEQTICKRRQTAMKTSKSIHLCAAVAAFSLTAALSAIAQQITGVPGSPGATTTL